MVLCSACSCGFYSFAIWFVCFLLACCCLGYGRFDLVVVCLYCVCYVIMLLFVWVVLGNVVGVVFVISVVI